MFFKLNASRTAKVRLCKKNENKNEMANAKGEK